jgi:hypothetical protein
LKVEEVDKEKMELKYKVNQILKIMDQQKLELEVYVLPILNSIVFCRNSKIPFRKQSLRTIKSLMN